LAEYGALVAAFLTALAQVSAFDAMLPSMKRVPSRVRVAIVSLGASAYVVGEGAPTGLTSLALDGRSLAEYKTAAILVVSDELLQATSVESAQLFRNELSTAVASVTDEKFVALVTSGLTPIASSGVDLASIWTDLGNLFHAVDTGAGSKLFLLVDPSTAKVLATKTTTTGAAAFPQVGFAGGQIGGATVLVTDALAAGTLLLIDAAAVAASAGSVGLAVVRHGDLQFETVPDSPAISTSVLRSLWQHNLTGLKAERAFGAELLRTSSAALLSAANYRTGNSPS
jgi:HK97 family phage major capsid protein